VIVARQGLSPLSGLIASRRWVTPSAENVQSAIGGDGQLEILGPNQLKLLDLQDEPADRLWGVEGEDHLLLARFLGDPATPARTWVIVENVVNGMIGVLGGDQHGRDGGDVNPVQR
jgi:hypothetical protein